MFLDIQVLREKQMTVSRDLEEKQTTCLQLQTTADELEVQIDTLSEERQRVSNLIDHKWSVFNSSSQHQHIVQKYRIYTRKVRLFS